ncbi:GIY-YIG nuclease family protein [Clostridium sp.]|uniref:GIY-YIG nuclease family protein n=1 Tax=Clostridium sp. TaxID=1506 RepID=UPI002602AD9D|nr:GIY-YIG nuclease family protein [Clostridium sp.]
MKINKNNLGYVYFILCENLVKIGTTKDIDKRIKQLSTGNGKEMKLIYYVFGGKGTEWGMHQRFQNDRVRGEWFNYSDDIKNWIRLDKLTREVMSQEIN